MKKINYKSDIPPVLISLSIEGKVVSIPNEDYLVRFYIDGYEGRHYDCSHIGGVWRNCEPSADGMQLVCYLDNQRLGIGNVCAEFHYIRPAKGYDDGTQKTVVLIDSTEVGIELVEDNGDTVTETSIAVTLPFIYRNAYDIAVDHGYTGTAEDFYKALVNIVSIDSAENARNVAERNREQNEAERLANEDIRQTNEQTRKNSEAERIKSEKIRNDNENLRIESEEDRKENFADLVDSFNAFNSQAKVDENNRKSNEQERLANEDARLTAESKRVSEEKMREQMESDRDTAEELRLAEENRRIANERQRIANEQSREERIAKKADKEGLYVTLSSMGFEMDNVGGGSVAYAPSVGDVYYDVDSKHIKYVASEGTEQDIGEPSDKQVYCNAVSKLLYIWRGGAWKNVGGVDAYTKSESDERYAVKATEGKVTALKNTVNVMYADLSGRLGYAEDAIVQVGNDVKNLRSDTVSALEKKTDLKQYNAFKQTATDKFDELDKTLEGKADEASVSAFKDDVTKTMDEFNTAIDKLGTELGETQSNLKSEISTKQDTLTAGVGIQIAEGVVSAKEEVLYDDYFYPNKQPTTDTECFTDSYEVLQPTAYVGDYTDAEGNQWQYVWECEGFPDWFDYAEANCYPYGNGISTGGIVLKTYTLNDAGELTYNFYNNKAAGRESVNNNSNNNNVGIKKIDDTHFTLYQHKGPTLNYFTGFNTAYLDPSTWCICNQCFYIAYDVTDCKRLKIEVSGQTSYPCQYSTFLTTDGANAQTLRGYVQRQVVYGTIANVFELNEDKTMYRVLRCTDSLYYRTSVTGAINYDGGDFVLNSAWIKIDKQKTSLRFHWYDFGSGKRVLFGTNGLYSPGLYLFHNCRIKITKLE